MYANVSLRCIVVLLNVCEMCVQENMPAPRLVPDIADVLAYGCRLAEVRDLLSRFAAVPNVARPERG